MKILNAKKQQERKCCICNSTKITVILEIPQVPIHCNILWPTRTDSLNAPKGDLQFAFCRNCGHFYNSAFTPSMMQYSQAYENSLHFSARFQRFAESLAERLIKKYDLHEKQIIDIGCGKGDFLKLLCKLGHNQGVGFDPSSEDSNHDVQDNGQIKFVKDFYSERYSKYKADFICCRHVLEHIQNPFEFLKVVRQAIGERLNTAIYFEVPNVMYTVRDMGIWDLIYEHYSYFSRNSLSHLFSISGFQVVSVTETFEGQYLSLEVCPCTESEAPTHHTWNNREEMSDTVARFEENYKRAIKKWRNRLESFVVDGKKIVIWGGGSKGVTFLNTFKVERIKYMVDINPRKQGKYVAGTGQKIISPKFLVDYEPEIVILMNPIYLNETRKLIQTLGLRTTVICAGDYEVPTQRILDAN